MIYPGHNYGDTPTATIDIQLQTNPFLQHNTFGEFLAHRMDGKVANTQLPPKPDWKPE